MPSMNEGGRWSDPSQHAFSKKLVAARSSVPPPDINYPPNNKSPDRHPISRVCVVIIPTKSDLTIPAAHSSSGDAGQEGVNLAFLVSVVFRL